MTTSENHEYRVLLAAESALSPGLSNNHLLDLCAMLGVDVEDVKRCQVFGRRHDEYPTYVSKWQAAQDLMAHIPEEQ